MVASSDGPDIVRPRRASLVALTASAFGAVLAARFFPSVSPWCAASGATFTVLVGASFGAALLAPMLARDASGRSWTRADEAAWAIALGSFPAVASHSDAPVSLVAVVHAFLLFSLASHNPPAVLFVLGCGSAVLPGALRMATMGVSAALPLAALGVVAFAAFVRIVAQARGIELLLALREAAIAHFGPKASAGALPSGRTRLSRPSLSPGARAAAQIDDQPGWEPLVEHLRVAVAGLAQNAGADASVQAEVAGLAPPSNQIRSNLPRLVHEAVAQMLRIAGARTVSVLLRRGDGGVVFELRDDGELGREARQRRSLAPLRARIAAMGATVDIHRSEGQWITSVRIPCDQLN